MKVFVGIPAYDGKVHIGTATSLATEAALAAKVGVDLRLSFQPGMSLVHAARNIIVANFLDSDCDRLVFIDADTGWPPGAVITLAARPQAIIAGACRRRKEPEDYAVYWADDITLTDGLIEVWGIGAAFMAISRGALEHLRDATPERAYEVEGRPVHGFFDSPVCDGRLWGEDVAFCRSWRKTGGKVWIDPTIELQHLEGLQTFSGTLLTWLQSSSHLSLGGALADLDSNTGL